MKKLMKSRTFWFGVGVAAIPFLESLSGLLVAEGAPHWITSLVGLTVICLRGVVELSHRRGSQDHWKHYDEWMGR